MLKRFLSGKMNLRVCSSWNGMLTLQLTFFTTTLEEKNNFILVEQELLPFRTAECIPVILMEQELLPFRTSEFIPVILVEQELLPFRTAEFIPVILVEQELLPFVQLSSFP